MTMPNADDFLMGGGIPSAKFETVGTAVTGTICLEPEVQQQRDFDTDEPKFWNDGKPMLQLRVVLQTTARNPEVEDDDGKRAIFIRGQMQKAVQQAVKAAGAKGLKVGGELTVTFVAEEPNSRGRGNPKKIYSAVYHGPDPLAQVAQQEPNAGQQTLPTQPVAASAQDGPPAGIDPAVWSSLNTEQRKAVAAAAGAPPF